MNSAILMPMVISLVMIINMITKMKKIFLLLALCSLLAADLCHASVRQPNEDLARHLCALSGSFFDHQSLKFVDYQYLPCNVVYEGDSVVWFMNIFPAGNFSSDKEIWVKGTVTNGILITIHPQHVFDYEQDGATYHFSVGAVSGDTDEAGNYLIGTPRDYQLVNNPQSGMIEPIDSKAYIAMYITEADAEGDVPSGLYDLGQNIAFNEINDQKVTPPEGEPKTFVSTYTDCVSGMPEDSKVEVLVASNGVDAYVKGLCPHFPESWIKGTVNEKQSIKLEAGQLLGVHGTHILYFLGAKAGDDDSFTVANLTLSYQSETGGYAVADGYFVGESTLDRTIVGMLTKVNMLPYEEHADCTPRNPYSLTLGKYPHNSIDDCEYFYFAVDNHGLDGDYIFKDSLYYQIFFDQDSINPCVFDSEDYPVFTEPTTMVPFRLDDTMYGDIVFYPLQSVSLLYVYGLFDSIGVRLVNRCAGVESYSDIVWIAHKDSGIDEIDSDPESMTYFNFAGQPVSSTSRGVVIGRNSKNQTIKIFRQ